MDDLRALLAAADLPWIAERQDHEACGHRPTSHAWLLTPDRMAVAVAAVNALPALLDSLGLLRETIEVVHQTGLLRDHADPNDKTGWNVHGIETCADSLCVEVLACLARLEDPK